MMQKWFTKQIILILLLPIGIVMNIIAKYNPEAVEIYFSMGLYKYISLVLNKLSGFFSFSVAEVILIILLVIVIWNFIGLLLKLYHQKNNHFYLLKDTFLFVISICSIVYFIFLITWGLNYNRVSIGKTMEPNLKPSNDLVLEQLCQKLIEKSNKLRLELGIPINKNFELKGGQKNAIKRANKGLEFLSYGYKEFQITYSNPKPVMLSELMSYSGISGIFTFFTAEANINNNVPPSFYPSTLCHEIAHQYGYAREDEANFISYLACNKHPDKDFQYSGSLLALSYTKNQLFTVNNGAYMKLKPLISSGVIMDLKSIDLFDKKYTGPVKEFSSKTNDLYLKANNQKDGEKSYNRMVELLIAEFISKSQ